MILALLTLLTGLSISAVAIYYSVLGLASIFSGAVLPIMIMGTILELSKLVAAWWLKSNWHRAPLLLKSYMFTAVMVLMLITSMGIFGFLSKAHSDQNLVSGDVLAKVSIIDEKIKIERENVANAQSVIKQMDAAVNGVIATGDQEVKLRDGSTKVNSAAERSLQIRRSQANDRAKLTKEIEDAQKRIVALQEESAPVRAEMRKVEAEVGPIKYIAAFVYGDNPDANVLEKAVTWVIITIIFVFDPLAVLLLLASQMSFVWAKHDESKSNVDQDTGESLRLPEQELINDNTDEINLSLSEDKEPDIDSTLQSIEDATLELPEPTVIEKIVEVPVDRVVEKVVEVPVEKIVEKVVEVPVPMDEFGRIMALNKTSGLEGLIAQKQKLLAKKDAEIASLKEQLSKTLVPDGIQADNAGHATTNGFGTVFPNAPEKGDTFLRVDYLPSRLYKWNGKRWIELDKRVNDGYAYNEEYIKHLATQLEQGKYSIDDLSDVEQEEIKRYLESK